MNEAIKKYFPKAPKISTIEDFNKIKERLVSEYSHTLKIYSKHEKDILVNCLGIRNKCGHPGAYMPEEHRVASFLEDLFNIIFSKQSLCTTSSKTIMERLSIPEDDGLLFEITYTFSNKSIKNDSRTRQRYGLRRT